MQTVRQLLDNKSAELIHIGPDATVHLDFALHRLAGVIEKLVVYPANMARNMDRFRGLVHSQRVMLALTQKGASREDAYALVQRNAMKAWEEGADFRAELEADPEVRARLSAPNHRSPSRFSITAGLCWRGCTSGRPAMARTCSSNCDTSQALRV